MDESIAKIKSRPGETGTRYHTYIMRDIDVINIIYHLQFMLNKGMIYLSNEVRHVCNTHDRRVLQVFENLDGTRELAEA